MPARHEIRIGISGWRYAPWRGVFYPPGLVQRRELEFAATRFDSIEVNGSFYGLLRPEYYARWYAQTPDDFVFSLKAPRLITHLHRLRDIEEPLGRFFASGVLGLGEKLGPLLWQFPPRMAYDETRWKDFLSMLPKDTDAARDCARRIGADVDSTPPRRRLRHAVEIRHPSFRDEGFIALLRRHRVALVVADTAGRWPYLEDVTADFLYLRLHGDQELYVSGYTDAALHRWAARIERWAGGGEPDDAVRVSAKPAAPARRRAVYGYFDNDVKVRAPFDALRLRALLGLDART
ncbi:DUF72 domain-containing protein [Dokdonella sp.]|uniref:DUF72 domain-containing protein n=1 Tax=Dokdonella sp. TaxID=2291710 RepID=UPI001B12F74D|nr:DUF72 domain-containing protein [Dokdonella sp.]MBO9662892.1 DUF72 domain-containing protein [Dokdonella sp.]